MVKIQQVRQVIHAKQFLIILFKFFLLATHLNLMRLKKHTDLVTCLCDT